MTARAWTAEFFTVTSSDVSSMGSDISGVWEIVSMSSGINIKSAKPAKNSSSKSSAFSRSAWWMWQVTVPVPTFLKRGQEQSRGWEGSEVLEANHWEEMGLGMKGQSWTPGSSWYFFGWDFPQILQVLESIQGCQEGLGGWDVDQRDDVCCGVAAAWKELLGQVMPAQFLDALRASYWNSNFDVETSSCTKILIDMQRGHSSYMGVERNPSWEE